MPRTRVPSPATWGARRGVDGRRQRALSASAENTVKVWELETGVVLATFTCDGGEHCCAFSDGGMLIVAGDASGHVHFLRLEEPKAKS